MVVVDGGSCWCRRSSMNKALVIKLIPHVSVTHLFLLPAMNKVSFSRSLWWMEAMMSEVMFSRSLIPHNDHASTMNEVSFSGSLRWVEVTIMDECGNVVDIQFYRPSALTLTFVDQRSINVYPKPDPKPTYILFWKEVREKSMWSTNFAP